MDIVTLAAAKKYTDVTVVGGGAIKGKNCTIDSISAITGGNRVTFKWTLDNGTEQTGTMDVMNGAKGDKGDKGNKGDTGATGANGEDGVSITEAEIDEFGHLIITFSDGEVDDLGNVVGGASWTDVTGTLTAGSTSITLTDESIKTTSTLDYYTSVFGVNPTNVSVSIGSVTLTFAAQNVDMGVKVRVS